MARTKQTDRRQSPRPLITLTRFYLPLDQDWPIWPVKDGGDPNVGPLEGVEGASRLRVGRVIDDPTQAVYIIEWALLQNFKAFQCSPACVEFVRGLPESNNPAFSAELQQLTLDDGAASLPMGSRFLLLQDCLGRSLENFDQVITLTTFSVPGIMDSDTWPQLFNPLRYKFNDSMPSGPPVTDEHRHNWPWTSNLWYMALEEDGWAAENFAPNQGEDNAGSHVIFCHIYRWAGFSDPLKQEAAAAADLEAAEERQRALAETKPPATAHVQERWVIHTKPSLELEDEEEDSDGN